MAAAARAELQEACEGREVLWEIGPLPAADADPGLLRLVFLNLFSNALKFTRPRLLARITVTAQDQEHEIIICVRDNGVGFDSAAAGELFGVFQRLHQTDEFEGTGLGLANVARIVQLHGGRVWAQSALDQGAAFFFSLPKGSIG